MNPAVLSPTGENAELLQAKWRQSFARWRDSLSECAHKPTRKHVHAVRSVTLRLRVMLEFCLDQLPSDANSVNLLKRWNKEGRKLRRVLAPIRDADVFLARLSTLKSARESASFVSVQLNTTDNFENAKCRREIEKLSRRLKQQRQQAVDELMKMLDERSKRLKRLSVKIVDYVDSQMPIIMSSASEEALSKLSALAEEVPYLASENLHSFRKGIKEALYLAELSAELDTTGKKLAITLRKMHVATGDWHDWHELAEVARSILPEHDEQIGVVPLLEKLSEEGLGRAVEVCRRSAAQIVKMGLDDGELQMRKPVDSVSVKDEDATGYFSQLA